MSHPFQAQHPPASWNKNSLSCNNGQRQALMPDADAEYSSFEPEYENGKPTGTIYDRLLGAQPKPVSRLLLDR